MVRFHRHADNILGLSGEEENWGEDGEEERGEDGEGEDSWRDNS